MKLYDTKMAPNPKRVRIFLKEKGIEVEKVEMNLIEGENLSADYLKINPRGLVPTLILDDGTVLDESVAICRYLEEIQPEPNLLGTDAKEKALIESWQRHVEFDGFTPLLECFRNSFPGFADRALPGLPPEYKAIPELAERGKRRYQLFLENLNKRLGENEYIAGNRFTIADITAYCGIGFAKVVKMTIPEQHKHTLRWHKQISERPSADA